MSTPTLPGFGQFIPGFDFLRQLTQAAGQAQQPAGAAIPGMPSLPSWSDWVAPTLQPEELQKRIGELKTVQFWLEQNNRAVAATVQALEVQKMTLSTLKNMGVPFEQWTEAFRSIAGQATDAASQFWRNGADGAAAMPANPFSAIFGGAQGAGSAADAAPAPAPSAARAADPQAHAAVPDFFSPFTAAFTGGGAAAPAAEPPAAPAPAPAAEDAGPAGGADPLKWWSALTGQFQEIARTAMQDLADRTATQVQSLTDAAGAATDAAVAAVATAVPQVPAAPRRRSAAAKTKASGTAAAKRADPAPAPAPAAAARKAAPARKAAASAAAPRRRASGR